MEITKDICLDSYGWLWEVCAGIYVWDKDTPFIELPEMLGGGYKYENIRKIKMYGRSPTKKIAKKQVRKAFKKMKKAIKILSKTKIFE